MLYSGIDLHKRTVVIATVDQTGKVLSEASLPTSRSAVARYFHELRPLRDLLGDQILRVEHQLQAELTPHPDVQHLLWTPGVGTAVALTLYLEIDGIERFDSVRQFFSYCRVVPGNEPEMVFDRRLTRSLFLMHQYRFLDVYPSDYI